LLYYFLYSLGIQFFVILFDLEVINILLALEMSGCYDKTKSDEKSSNFSF